MRPASFQTTSLTGLTHRRSSADLRRKLLLHLASRRRGNSLASAGFTLIELMVVIVIVGILAAVAIPQFMNQTKKATATEGTTQASAILKQAAAYNLETPIDGVTEVIDTNCIKYAGTFPTGTKFKYTCGGTAEAFTVTADGIDTTNAKGIKIVAEGNLTTGVVKKTVISGI